MDTMKGESQNIFDVLFEKNICFAVCVSANRLICEDFDMHSNNYFVIINRCDVEAVVSDLIFYKTDGYKQIFECKLSQNDVNVFKRIISKFVKVKHIKYGRIYELRGNSFKETFDVEKERFAENEIIAGLWW